MNTLINFFAAAAAVRADRRDACVRDERDDVRVERDERT